jgi:phage protein D
MGLETLQPDFSVVINGETELVKDRVISVHTTDEAGIMSDSCEIELDDFDDAFPIPRTETVISVSLGYKGGELTKIGSYYVKEIDIDGARKTLKIKANAASKAMRSQKSKSHEGSMDNLLAEMANEFDLDAAVSGDLEGLELEDFTQFAESDMNYMTRLSQKVGAVGTVFANWYDKDSGEYHMVSAGSGDPEVELDEIFSSEKSALAAAQAKFKRVVKSNKTFRFTTGGRPDFFAESPIIFSGLSPKIPNNWVISRVEHTLSASGFITAVDCANIN